MEELNAQPETNKNTQAFAALIELDNKERSFKSRASYYRVYLLSVILPPIGIYYLVKYLFFGNGSDDDIKAGFISLGLTVISLLLTIWISIGMFKTATNLSPSQSNEMLKEYTNPDNQKIMKDLFQ